MRLDCAKRFGRFAGEREVYLRNSMETNKNGLDVIFWGGRFFLRISKCVTARAHPAFRDTKVESFHWMTPFAALVRYMQLFDVCNNGLYLMHALRLSRIDGNTCQS